MDAPGCYVPQWKSIFINENLSEDEMKLVILHEIKHVIDHVDYSNMYKVTITRMKMEAEANDYMIDKIIEENGGVYNYTQLIEGFNIRMGKDIKYCN